MAYDEYLEERLVNIMQERRVVFTRKKMMGGLAIMVDDKMCVGITGDLLMVRLDPDIYDSCLQKEGCKPMEFTGRPMKGFVHVEPHAIDMDDDLAYWVELALEFNPRAKSSKKK